MPELDLETIRHLLTVAKQQGFAEADIHAGQDAFWARFDRPARTSASRRSEGGAALVEFVDGAANENAIYAPFVGYYRAHDPPLHVGQHIEKGEIVASVAALGLAHDVEAPCSGEVVELLVEPGQAVQFGQALAKVKVT